MIHNIIDTLAPHAILVGSAARSKDFNDIDLVVSEKGLAKAKQIFPNPQSILFGQIKTFDTEIPIEVFTFWYGPYYAELVRRKRELIEIELFGVSLRAWPNNTQHTDNIA